MSRRLRIHSVFIWEKYPSSNRRIYDYNRSTDKSQWQKASRKEFCRRSKLKFRTLNTEQLSPLSPPLHERISLDSVDPFDNSSSIKIEENFLEYFQNQTRDLILFEKQIFSLRLRIERTRCQIKLLKFLTKTMF